MSILHNSPTLPVADKHTSAPQNTAVGSGSRPTKSKHMIETSAPSEPQHLDGRFVPGSLGHGTAKPMGY